MSASPRPDIPALSALPLVIDTARLRLRPIAEADADAYYPFVSDPELPKYVSWSAHTSLDETREWLRGAVAMVAASTDMVWAIEHEGAPVGVIGLHGIKWKLRALRMDRAELGYWIARPFWGKGLMTEAAGAATTWAFDVLGLHKVNVMCFEENVGSRRVIEKNGFRFIGRAEDDIWRDGRWHAHLKYERVRT